jgi:hypothetical protein
MVRAAVAGDGRFPGVGAAGLLGGFASISVRANSSCGGRFSPTTGRSYCNRHVGITVVALESWLSWWVYLPPMHRRNVCIEAGILETALTPQ